MSDSLNSEKPGAPDADQISSSSVSEPVSNKMENSNIVPVVTRASQRRIGEWEAMQIAEAGDFETIDAEVNELEAQLRPRKNRWYKYELSFEDPKYFTWLLVGFASMGGLLSGVDQSLISGANLYMPKALGLNSHQQSLVSSGVPLGAVGGALMLGPLNENFGRRNAIIISLVFYTIGAALCAGA